MSWAERLLRLGLGDPRRQTSEFLESLRQHANAQAARLAAYAAQAPTAAAERELTALAAARQAQVEALTATLGGRPTAAPTATATVVPNGPARNHWARLVAALESCRIERADAASATPRMLEISPDLAQPLDAYLRTLDAELLALRGMIARADPQALN